MSVDDGGFHELIESYIKEQQMVNEILKLVSSAARTKKLLQTKDGTKVINRNKPTCYR